MLSLFARRLARRPSPVRRSDAVILMYHRVDVADADPWRLAVRPKHFAEHLDVIRGSFEPIALTRLRARLRTGDIPRRSVAVTFDDGYRDNLVNAEPLLQRNDVPATLFVTSGYLDSQRDFWWEELTAVCSQSELDPRVVWERLQPLTRLEREAELEQLWLAAGSGAPPASMHTVTSEEIAAVAGRGIFEIGAHTVTHPSLPSISPAEQAAEISTSKLVLEGVVGRPVSTFSYPHGDVSPQTVEAVRDGGFDTACTTSGEPLTRRSTPLELPRLHVLDWPGGEFEAQLERRLGSRKRR